MRRAMEKILRAKGGRFHCARPKSLPETEAMCDDLMFLESFQALSLRAGLPAGWPAAIISASEKPDCTRRKSSFVSRGEWRDDARGH